MEILSDLVKIMLPSATILVAMYLTVKAFLNKEFEKRLVEYKTEASKVVLPIRLQAYERMCLFLERITPNNLIIRVNNPAFTVSQFQQVLLSEIREELNHNLSQQVYMSDASWAQIKKTADEIMSVINHAAYKLPPEAKGIELAKAIFDELMKWEEEPTAATLRLLKAEIRQSF
ncbi:MAG: hypothetical protein K2Q22_08255 [Cytophagales bacterium]|nr:hypothetical protein [Cytophagales bacterium]